MIDYFVMVFPIKTTLNDDVDMKWENVEAYRTSMEGHDSIFYANDKTCQSKGGPEN